ncbi:MAG: PilZ domain-containing protein [Erythrobacter sp.]|nr:PilZ domain-containing protein [Erythrobacter sp.]NCQ62331.1 PilZ domain-containing protein [Alphaproteobacteria bacterium]
MSTHTMIADEQSAANAQHPGEADYASDRRKNERQIATFRTCCVVIGDEAHPAILRNMSDGGAMFEALVSPRRDDIITYWWDGIDAVEARVAWVQGTRIGVANLSGPASAIDVPRPRATRVPAQLPVRVWAGGWAYKAELENISLSGICVCGLGGVAPGTPCTVEIGGQTLPNASVVRTDGDMTGIRFEKPLPPARLMKLLDSDGTSAQVVTRRLPTPDVPQPLQTAPPEVLTKTAADQPPAAPPPLRRAV